MPRSVRLPLVVFGPVWRSVAAGVETDLVGSSPSSDVFDQWYVGMRDSSAKDAVVQRHLGLPADLLSSSLLPWEAVTEVTAALRLSPGEVVVDLACGRGGYGLEVARRSGAQLVGVDFSGEAVRQAAALARRSGRSARFAVGELIATGLAAGSVDAVMCVDAIQFAEPADAAYGEIRRLLSRGRRVVLTCWEPLDPGVEGLPERFRKVDLAAGLAAAGFVDIVVQERADWAAVEHALWQEAAALDPGPDAALRSLHVEAVRVLEHRHLTRRVMASATAN